MRKCMLMFFLSLLVLICQAPEYKYLTIIRTEPIQPYEALIKAVCWVESKHGKHVWNPREKAVGWFQIRPIRVADYNKRTGSHYKLEDFYNYELSKKMFLYYAQGKSLEKAAKDWNGRGPKTIKYWSQIKEYLYCKN